LRFNSTCGIWVSASEKKRYKHFTNRKTGMASIGTATRKEFIGIMQVSIEKQDDQDLKLI
jgi:hypothetical protein